AALLGALVGVDANDPTTRASAGRYQADYRPCLKPDGLRGARLGVARGFAGFHDRVDALLESALQVLRDLGAELVDPAEVPTRTEYGEPEWEVLQYEFKADLNAYLATRPGLACRTLEDLIAFNRGHAAEEMPFFAQEIFLKSQEKGPLTDEAYLKARDDARRLAGEEGIDKVLAEHRLDALVAPTGGPAWLIDYVNGDCGSGGCSSAAAAAGYPHLTVPAGFVRGLPVGLSFFGTAWSEPTLIRLAYAFEQATLHRRPPRLLPTVDFGATG
ncbi:MAG: amidase family protein, partial [Gemmatimonadota bacterium]